MINEDRYSFRPAEKYELDIVFDLISIRIKWMDSMGINQWNKVDYWHFYPKEYFIKACNEKRLFVLYDTETEYIVAIGVLSSSDKRWIDNKKAIYLHNFVTVLDRPGVGSIFLDLCEKYALSLNIDDVRLDCKKSNDKLNKYYEDKGYELVDVVVDGEYVGNKREKNLR